MVTAPSALPPSGVTQVGGLTVGPAPSGNGVMVQGTVNIAPNAPVGTPTSPPQIGLNQIVNGCNENSNTIPYYLTPACPSSISLAGSGTEDLESIFNAGYRTGIGIYTEMQLNPPNGLWSNATPIYEMLSQGSNNCQGNGRTSGNVCTWQLSPFTTINTPFMLFNGTTEPAMANIFYDQHITVDRLPPHNSMLNVLGLNTCQATCNQVYSCGGHQVSTYSINYSYTRDQIQGTPVTRVGVTKTQTGSDMGSGVVEKKH
jgi:hypothetical protein